MSFPLPFEQALVVQSDFVNTCYCPVMSSSVLDNGLLIVQYFQHCATAFSQIYTFDTFTDCQMQLELWDTLSACSLIRSQPPLERGATGNMGMTNRGQGPIVFPRGWTTLQIPCSFQLSLCRSNAAWRSKENLRKKFTIVYRFCTGGHATLPFNFWNGIPEYTLQNQARSSHYISYGTLLP